MYCPISTNYGDKIWIPSQWWETCTFAVIHGTAYFFLTFACILMFSPFLFWQYSSIFFSSHVGNGKLQGSLIMKLESILLLMLEVMHNRIFPWKMYTLALRSWAGKKLDILNVCGKRKKNRGSVIERIYDKPETQGQPKTGT